MARNRDGSVVRSAADGVTSVHICTLRRAECSRGDAVANELSGFEHKPENRIQQISRMTRRASLIALAIEARVIREHRRASWLGTSRRKWLSVCRQTVHIRAELHFETRRMQPRRRRCKRIVRFRAQAQKRCRADSRFRE